MKRFFKWGALALVVVVVLGAVVFFWRLNSILRNVIQTQSQSQLNVPTQLASANLSLFGGSVKLDEFNIGSPPGFSADKMFSMNSVKVDVNYRQLTKDPVRVQDIQIDQPRLVLEQANGKFNIKALMEQLPKSPPSSNDGNRKEGEPIKMIIDRLAINNAEVVIRPGIESLGGQAGGLLKGLNLEKEYKLTVPPIELKDIGNSKDAKNGAALQDVLMTVVSAVASKAAESDKIPAPLRGLLSGDLSSITENLRDRAGEAVSQQIDKLKDKVGDKIGGDAGKFVGGLLGGGKGSSTQTAQPGPVDKKVDEGMKKLDEGLKDIFGGSKKKPAQ